MTTLYKPYSAIQTYLSSHLKKVLIEEGTLPDEARAILATELRNTLVAYAAYIPGRLVQQHLIAPKPGRIQGAFWNGSLLFADMSGFTALSEKLSVLGKQGAEEISGVINTLFSALVDEVLVHQGTLLKFGGDALTAFFDADTLGDMHAVAGTLAALALQERMKAFAALKTRQGVFQLQLRVGVHSGKVFAAEVGCIEHIELVITGSEVNRVATAQEIAAPGEVVISNNTAVLLGGTDATLVPREAGFYSITHLSAITMPLTTHDLIPTEGPDDIATLDQLAAHIAALRPYLVRGLPGRFLDMSVFEMGEFRPVSVLFANFHNFSATLELLNDYPQHAANILNAYFNRAQAVVHRYDGIVNKVDMYTHGDKLMALFGAPITHEDDPLRATRCALDMAHALDDANHAIIDYIQQSDITNKEAVIARAPLHQSIGINTGTVYAGRVGGMRRYEYTVMGSNVNLSARLMAATDDGTVLLSPATKQAVERQIATTEHAPIRLKGLAEPVVPFYAVQAFDIEHIHNHPDINRAPLIGRDTIMHNILQRAMSALRGTGHTIALVGDAGIGKSRLVEEITQRLVLGDFGDVTDGDDGDDGDNSSIPDFQIYSNDCQSYEQSIPYATIRKPLQTLLNFSVKRDYSRIYDSGPGNDPIQMLEGSIGQIAPHMLRFTPLLGDILGIELPETPLIRSLSAEQRYERLRELIVGLFLYAANHEPLLLILEDIQWADASSLDIVAHLTQQVSSAALLLLLNYRYEPPIDEPWAEKQTTTRIELDELSDNDSATLLMSMLNGSPPQEILSLLDRTQGNPFFIEELVRNLVNNGILARNDDDNWILTQSLDNVAIPTSIEGLIYARLDMLKDQEYDVVQEASVIGRRFQRSILRQLYTQVNLLDRLITNLVDEDVFLYEHHEQVEDTYIFRHALLRDVAYEGILYSRRRDLHHQVAYCMENTYRGNYHYEHLVLLASHYLLAEEWLFAFYFHKQAGIQAQKRYANQEALSLFATAIGIVDHFVANEQYHDTEKNDALFDVFCPLFPIEYQLVELYERSGYIYTLQGEGTKAEETFTKALDIVAILHDYPHQLRLSDSLNNYFYQQLTATYIRLYRHIAALHEQHGNYDQSLEWLERGIALAQHQTNEDSESELARCYIVGARTYRRLAELDKSFEWAHHGLDVAQRLNNKADQAEALIGIGTVWIEKGDLAQSIPPLNQARVLFEELNIANGLNNALNDLGVVYDRLGRWKEATNCYGRSLQISENIGDIQAMARTSNNLALVLLAQGELERANQLYEYSCNQFRHIGSEQGVAYTTLNRGEVLLLQGQPENAMELFYESMEILARINARVDMPEVLRLAAEAMLAMGKYDQATLFASQSFSVACEQKMALEQATAQRTQGQIALARNELNIAQEHFDQSQAVLEELGERYELGKVCYWQAKLACARGQCSMVTAMVSKSHAIFTELDAQRDLALLQELVVQIEQSHTEENEHHAQ